jgi:2-iminobutanoate/2-iminopropanoate deaminase
MEKIIIHTDRAPKPKGPYSQAIKYGKLLFTSGQTALDPKTNQLVNGSIEIEARRVLDNIKEILEATKSSLKEVIKVTVYLKNMNDYQKFNEVYSLYFEDSKPARTCVEVSNLPMGAAVEIEVIAISH